PRKSAAHTDGLAAEHTADAETGAPALRHAVGQQPGISPVEVVDHVDTAQTPQLAQRPAELAEEIARDTTTEQQGQRGAHDEQAAINTPPRRRTHRGTGR